MKKFYLDIVVYVGFPDGTGGKEPACQCRRYETWVPSLGQEDSPGGVHGNHSSTLIVIHSHKLSDIPNSAMTVLRLTIKIKR